MGLACLFGVAASNAPAQSVFSSTFAKPGIINYTEGRVLLNDGAVRTGAGRFPQAKAQELATAQNGWPTVSLNPATSLLAFEGRIGASPQARRSYQVLSGSSRLQTAELDAIRLETGRFPRMLPRDVLTTEEGRVEVLLNAGSFLRIGERSSVRLVSDSLSHPGYEVLSGSSVLEVAEVHRDAPLTILCNSATISPVKGGVFRVDTDPARLRVFDGEASVQSGGKQIRVGKGKMLALDGSWTVAKFNPERTDALDRWIGRRAEYLSMANIPLARSAAGYSQNCYTGLWSLNLYSGTMTYVPCNGIYRSHYGYNFYSYAKVLPLYSSGSAAPGDILGRAGLKGTSSYPGSTYSTMESTSAGTSGTIADASPASTTQSSASSAPISRDAGNAGGQTR
jgi:ferric-dicitrate binding protein FerR (iron transport regulator)